MSRPSATADVLIIGGGIAGATAAASLSAAGLAVVLFERETQLATHTTGRSAATFIENYAGPTVTRLTQAGAGALREGGFLSPRGVLDFGGPGEGDRIRASFEDGRKLVAGLQLLDADEACAMVPALRRDMVSAAIFEPDAADIDVAALHAFYIARARSFGAVVLTGVGTAVPLARPSHGGWAVQEWTAPVVVNAAGAWADEVAHGAGIPSIGFTPLRRTAFISPGPTESGSWPLVHGPEGLFYFRPEPGANLLCSPADETPSPPCDARHEPVDVARAIESIHTYTDLELRHVRQAWAGLRTFSPDRAPVIGFEPGVDGFCWLAGQGGFGIQTAPGQGMAVAGLVVDGALPESLAALGLTSDVLSPARFRT